MSSRIEQLIDEIEEYIDSCNYQRFSNTKIVVNKDEIEELIRELRVKTPDEIKRYQRIIQNKEEILNDAKAKAEQLIEDTAIQRTELISEHQIMQQAYAEADVVVTEAHRRAQEMLDRAVMEANEMRMSAMQYTDDLLAHVEGIIAGSIQTASADYENLIGHMKQYQEIIASNRRELMPIPEDLEEESSDAAGGKENLELM